MADTKIQKQDIFTLFDDGQYFYSINTAMAYDYVLCLHCTAREAWTGFYGIQCKDESNDDFVVIQFIAEANKNQKSDLMQINFFFFKKPSGYIY